MCGEHPEIFHGILLVPQIVAMDLNNVMGETMIVDVYNIFSPEIIYYKTKCVPSCNSSIICAQYSPLSRCERCGRYERSILGIEWSIIIVKGHNIIQHLVSVPQPNISIAN